MTERISDHLQRNFQTVYTIFEITQQLRVPAAELQEVAINAAIALTHLEKTSEAFEELARQIQGVSTRLLQLRDRVQPLTEGMSHQILAAFRISIQSEPFLLIPEELSLSARHLVIQARTREIQHSFQYVQQAKRLLAQLSPEYGEWRQLLSRLWSVVLNLRVLATEVRGEEREFLLAMAGRIETLYSTQDPMTARWFSLIERCRQELSRLSHQRTLHAA